MKKLILFTMVLFIPFLVKSQKREQEKELKIDTTEIVVVNGIRQFLSIKAQDSVQPILLFLHGGPGTSLMESAEGFSDKLKQEFIVIQWDQRQTGETLKLNTTDQPLTTGLLKSDADQIIRYILKKYHRKKLYLVSHSWGSVLGFDIAEKHPELLYAYIAISPIIDQNKAGEWTVDLLKDWAKSQGNQHAQDDLKQVKVPFETKDDLFYTQKWLFIKNGVSFAQKENFKTNYYQWLDVWFPIWKESVAVSMFTRLKSVDCPVYFIEGNADKYRSHYLVQDYYRFIKAPEKEFYWMTKSGHTVFNTEPDKLQDIIINIKKKIR